MRDLYTNLIAYVRSLVGNKVGINENAHEDREMFTHPWDQSKARRRVFLLEIANHLSVAFYCIKQPTGNGRMYSMQVCLSVEQTNTRDGVCINIQQHTCMKRGCIHR